MGNRMQYAFRILWITPNLDMMTRLVRYLGIDYGTKRIGLALSDEGGTIAFPRAVLEAKDDAVSHIATLAEQEGVGLIVLGESHDLLGNPNAVMKRIERFKLALEAATSVPVAYEPEFMTSAQAARPAAGEERTIASPGARAPQGPMDASAAALILQGYIDRMKNVGAQ